MTDRADRTGDDAGGVGSRGSDDRAAGRRRAGPGMIDPRAPRTAGPEGIIGSWN